MAKRASSKPAAQAAKAAAASAVSGPSPEAGTSQVSAHFSTNPQNEGASAAAAESGSQGGDSTTQQPPGSLASSQVVQAPRRPLWPVLDRTGNVFQEGDIQQDDEVSVPSADLSEATPGPSAEPSAAVAPVPAVVMPGKYLTRTGVPGRIKTRIHTPEPPDLGIK